jgi:septum site-determining protein MinD
VILDAPAGIESGYEHTIEFADKALVVVNPEVSSIRDSDRAIGILDSKSQKVKDGQDVDKFLIINRIDPAMVQSGEMLQSEDILDILSIPLIGKVPEDKGIIDASNQGKPIILDQNSKAGQAYMRIASRLCGNKVDFVDVESENGGLLQKIKGMFS